MSERDRLINELKKAKNNCLIRESGGCLGCKYRGQADCTLENLADRLLENGVICPPCNCAECKYLKIIDKAPIFAECSNPKVIRKFLCFEEDTRKASCEYAEAKMKELIEVDT